MSAKFFGQYLIEQKVVQREDLFRAIRLQDKVNLRFGDIILGMGLMTEKQLTNVHRAQSQEDLRFGDMAVKMGYLTPDQVALVLAKQRKNYLFIGEALVQLGALTPKQLNTFLERFHQMQKPLASQTIEIPDGIPHRSVWELVVDMHCKMLTRFVGLSSRLGPGRSTNCCPQRQVTVEAGFSGEINARLLITLSKKTQVQLTSKVLNSGIGISYPEPLQDEALVKFLDLVCGNIVSKAALQSYEIDMTPVRMHQPSTGLNKGAAEIGLLFPIYLPDEEAIEITIFAMEKIQCLA